MNFVGYRDFDGSGINNLKEKDLLFNFIRDTKLEGAYCCFPKNKFISGDGCRTLIDNGSMSGCRHAVETEKNIIKNIVSLFSNNAPYRIEHFEIFDNAPFRTICEDDSIANFDGDGDFYSFFVNGEEHYCNTNIVEGIFKDYFKQSKCDVLDLLRKFDSTGIKYKGEEIKEFISDLKEFLLKEMNMDEMPFDTSDDIYNSINKDEQISNNQFAPLHFLQSIVAACMM